MSTHNTFCGELEKIMRGTTTYVFKGEEEKIIPELLSNTMKYPSLTASLRYSFTPVEKHLRSAHVHMF